MTSPAPEFTDDRVPLALKHAHHATDLLAGTPAPATHEFAHDHAVAREGDVGVIRGDLQADLAGRAFAHNVGGATKPELDAAHAFALLELRFG